MDGGQRRFDHTAQREVIKSDDSDILGDPVSAFFESLYGAYGDQIIVCEIAGSQFFSVFDEFHHVSICTLHRRSEFVDDGAGRRHPGRAHCLVKTRGTLCKVADRIGRVKISGLCFACLLYTSDAADE